MLIYLITNAANGKLYVGQTNKHSAEDRLVQHFGASRRGGMQLICRAIRKHGEQSFTIQVLARGATRDDLNRLERQYIAALRTTDPSIGYNQTSGGVATVNEGPLSPEHRRKISETQKANPNRAMLGRKHSPESIAAMSASKKGKPKTDDHRRKLSQSITGSRPNVSPEVRAKRSEAMKGNTRGLGYKHTPDELAKISAASKGNKFRQGSTLSPEHRAALRAGAARYYDELHKKVSQNLPEQYSLDL